MHAQTMHGLSLLAALPPVPPTSLLSLLSPPLLLVFLRCYFLNFATFLHTFRRAANKPYLATPLPSPPLSLSLSQPACHAPFVSAASIFLQRHFAMAIASVIACLPHPLPRRLCLSQPPARGG